MITGDYNLDDQVEVWSDYLLARYHPKTNIVINEYQHKNKLYPFDVFGLGQQVWKSTSNDAFEILGETVEDHLRFFAEECDNLQGFQLLYDSHDAFAGLSASLVNHLADDYGSKMLVSLPTSPAYYEDYSANTGNCYLKHRNSNMCTF